jgi:predicted ATPase
MRDVHNHDPLQLYNHHKDMMETNRKKYEHKSKINELIKNIDKEKEEKMEETDDDEEDYIDEDTSTEQEREIHDAEVGATFDKQAAIKSSPKEDKNYIYLTIEELTKRVRSLNPQQRRIFDDIIERLSDPNVENKPFYLYLAGGAGTGKSYLVETIIAVVKHIKKKSGKNELEKKPSVLVMAPNSAFLIGGKTIDLMKLLLQG